MPNQSGYLPEGISVPAWELSSTMVASDGGATLTAIDQSGEWVFPTAGFIDNFPKGPDPDDDALSYEIRFTATLYSEQVGWRFEPRTLGGSNSPYIYVEPSTNVSSNPDNGSRVGSGLGTLASQQNIPPAVPGVAYPVVFRWDRNLVQTSITWQGVTYTINRYQNSCPENLKGFSMGISSVDDAANLSPTVVFSGIEVEILESITGPENTCEGDIAPREPVLCGPLVGPNRVVEWTEDIANIDFTVLPARIYADGIESNSYAAAFANSPVIEIDSLTGLPVDFTMTYRFTPVIDNYTYHNIFIYPVGCDIYDGMGTNQIFIGLASQGIDGSFATELELITSDGEGMEVLSELVAGVEALLTLVYDTATQMLTMTVTQGEYQAVLTNPYSTAPTSVNCADFDGFGIWAEAQNLDQSITFQEEQDYVGDIVLIHEWTFGACEESDPCGRITNELWNPSGE